MPNNELKHYGVMGMKWGIRKYRRRDGTLTERGKKHYAELGATVTEAGKKVSHLSRLSSNLKLKNKDVVPTQTSAQAVASAIAGYPIYSLEKRKLVTYTYDTDNKHDNDVYKGAYSKFIKDGFDFAKIYEHQYVTKFTTISPSKQERVDAFVTAYTKDKQTYSDLIQKNQAQLEKYKNDPRAEALIKQYYKDLDYSKLKDSDYIKKRKDDLYESFARTQERNSGVYAKGNKSFYDELLKRGYDSLVDDNNKDIYNKAETPTIYLNPKNALKETSTREVTNEEQRQAEERLQKDAKKRKYHIKI